MVNVLEFQTVASLMIEAHVKWVQKYVVNMKYELCFDLSINIMSVLIVWVYD